MVKAPLTWPASPTLPVDSSGHLPWLLPVCHLCAVTPRPYDTGCPRWAPGWESSGELMQTDMHPSTHQPGLLGQSTEADRW